MTPKSVAEQQLNHNSTKFTTLPPRRPEKEHNQVTLHKSLALSAEDLQTLKKCDLVRHAILHFRFFFHVQDFIEMLFLLQTSDSITAYQHTVGVQYTPDATITTAGPNQSQSVPNLPFCLRSLRDQQHLLHQ